MPRRTLAAVLVLAALSVAAGLIAPGQPFPGGNLWVASPDAVQLFEFDGAGLLQPTRITGLTALNDLAFGPDGALYASDEELDRVLVFDGAGASLGSIGAGSGLNSPSDLGFGPDGGLYVASSGSDAVLRFERDGSLGGSVGGGSGLDDPRGLAFGADGHLYVSSFGSDRVLEFDPSGVLLGELGAGTSLVGPWGLVIGPGGHLLVASHGTDRVLEFDGDGALLRTLGAGTDIDGPTSLALGPDRLLYVASLDSDEVVLIDADGLQVDTRSAPTLINPTGLAFSPTVMSVSLKGRAEAPGDKAGKLQADGRLSLFPGSGRAMLLLPEAGDALIELFGDDVLVFDGFEFIESEKLRHLAGQQMLDDGAGMLGLELKGQQDPAGHFRPDKARGVLHREGREGLTDLDVKSSGKPLSDG